jgi:hypothetical protein
MRRLGPPVVVSIAGTTIEERGRIARLVEDGAGESRVNLSSA